MSEQEEQKINLEPKNPRKKKQTKEKPRKKTKKKTKDKNNTGERLNFRNTFSNWEVRSYIENVSEILRLLELLNRDENHRIVDSDMKILIRNTFNYILLEGLKTLTKPQENLCPPDPEGIQDDENDEDSP